MNKILIFLYLTLIIGCASNRIKEIEKPVTEPSRKSIFYYSEADLAEKDYDYLTALYFFQIADEEDPESLEIKERILRLLSILAANEPEYNEQLTILGEDYLSRGFISDKIYLYLSNSYLQKQNYSKAIFHIEKALELKPSTRDFLRLYQIKRITGVNEPDLLNKAFDIEGDNRQLSAYYLSELGKIDNEIAEEYIINHHKKWNDEESLNIITEYYQNNKDYKALKIILEEYLAQYSALDTQKAFILINMFYNEREFSKIYSNYEFFKSKNDLDIDRFLISATIEEKDYFSTIDILERVLNSDKLTEADQKTFYAFLGNYKYLTDSISESALCFSKVNDYSYFRSFLNQDEIVNDQSKLNNLEIWYDNLSTYSIPNTVKKLVYAKINSLLNQKMESIKMLDSILPDSLDQEQKIETIYLYLNLEQNIQAEKIFNSLDSLNTSFNTMAAVYFRSMKLDSLAIPYLEDEINSKGSDASESYLIYSSILELQGKENEAIFILEQAIKEFPTESNVLNALGYLLVLYTDDLERAEKLLNQAIILQPDGIHIWDSLAWLEYKKKNYDKAIAFMEKPIKSGVNNSTIAYHIGEIYNKLDILDLAKSYFILAIELATEEEAVENAKKSLERIE